MWAGCGLQVSVNPKYRDDCLKGAKYVARMLEGLGADVKVVQVRTARGVFVPGGAVWGGGGNAGCRHEVPA